MTVEVPAAGTPAVELLVPGTWVPLDLDPATRVRSITGLLDPAAPPDARRRAQALLEATTYQAVKAGAALAYLFSSVREGKLAAASLLVSVVGAAPGAEETNPGPAAVATALAQRYGGEAGELPAGPGARVRRRQRVEPLRTRNELQDARTGRSGQDRASCGHAAETQHLPPIDRHVTDALPRTKRSSYHSKA